MTEPILRVEKLVKHFPVRRGARHTQAGAAVRAVDGIDFELAAGETLGLVGESGCGKSTVGKLVTKLLDPTSGRVYFDGADITELSPRAMRPLRRDIQMIFQDPYSSLNPRHNVGTIIGTAFRLQKALPDQQIKAAVQELLEIVGLSPEHYNRYPHEFSGGQRQRIGIARALALRPKVIVCDEPVSALDVSIRAQILNLLCDLQEELGLSYLFIAHDLAAVAHMSHTIVVMYLGKIVEQGEARTLARTPKHPYTEALFSAALPSHPDERQDEIILAGEVPSPLNPPL